MFPVAPSAAIPAIMALVDKRYGVFTELVRRCLSVPAVCTFRVFFVQEGERSLFVFTGIDDLPVLVQDGFVPEISRVMPPDMVYEIVPAVLVCIRTAVIQRVEDRIVSARVGERQPAPAGSDEFDEVFFVFEPSCPFPTGSMEIPCAVEILHVVLYLIHCFSFRF